MRRAWLCMLFILILLLCGCAAQKPAAETSAPETPAEPVQSQPAAEPASTEPRAESVDLLEGLKLSDNMRKQLEAFGDDLYGIQPFGDGWYLLWMSTDCDTPVPLHDHLQEAEIQLAIIRSGEDHISPIWTQEKSKWSTPIFYDFGGIHDGMVSYTRAACCYLEWDSSSLYIITPNILADGTKEPATVDAVPYDTAGTEPVLIQHDGMNRGDPIWFMEVPYEITDTGEYELHYGDYSFVTRDFNATWPDSISHPDLLPEDPNPVGAQVLEAAKDDQSEAEYAFFSEHLPYLRGLKKLNFGAVLCWYSTQIDPEYYEQYGEDLKIGFLNADRTPDPFYWVWLANGDSEIYSVDLFYRDEEDRTHGRSFLLPFVGIDEISLLFVSGDGVNVPYDSIGTEPIIFDQPDCNNGKPLYIFEVNMYEAPDDYTLYYGDYTVTKDQFYALEWEP